MQIEIDPISEVPLYQQLRDRVVEGIAAGRLRPGDKLTPVRQLAGQFGINIATVGKGYDLLRAEGLVRTNRTAGSVIARGPHTNDGSAPEWDAAARAGWEARLTTVLAEAVAQGETDGTVLTAAGSILADFADRRSNGDTGAGENDNR
ncbi:GntR family transcriptional regulator [Planctomonas sp. JC2975]|uniref:GntR family transcriptional regulator n=1 Tax=Planctomonas sp. JC2975 TaxID=2729626 RepID=UPI001475068A|nr:GntR family transcriptional regulator [Planctomonas sp. JC2975]NNC11310.1 GntR family transcriptional regulator [Planctomonas sp. JC2975]